MRTSLLSAAMLGTLGTLFSGAMLLAQHSTYAIDPAHSQVDFGIKHMGISTVHGRFAIKEGTIELDPQNMAQSAVTATIDVTSVDTGVGQRDAHLRSPDFFDTAKFPTATFKSTKVTPAGDGFEVMGELTLHGVTRPVTLHMEPPSKEQIGMEKVIHRGFTATTTLHRQDFGLTWNGTLKSGDNMLGDDVKMEFDVEAAKR